MALHKIQSDRCPFPPAICWRRARRPVSSSADTAGELVDASNGSALFGIVSLQPPVTDRELAGTQPRLQTLSQQLGTGGQLDRVPAAPDAGGVIALMPPAQSTRTAVPGTVQSGIPPR
jgi:hypothetical protein